MLLALLAVYLSLITGQIRSELVDAWMFQIQIFPIVAVGLFGVSDTAELAYICVAHVTSCRRSIQPDNLNLSIASAKTCVLTGTLLFILSGPSI